MKVKKSMVGVTVIVVLAIMVNSVIIGRNIYKESLKKNVDIYISSVSLIEKPDDPKNENIYDLIEQFINLTVGDICVYYDTRYMDKEFSETEKSMKFDLSNFNLYIITISCDKKNIAKNKYVFSALKEFCQADIYMNVPCNVSSDICGDNTLYYFVSKEYNEEDVKHYLKDTGIPIYTNIGKDELHSIVNYNQTIYFKQ